MSARSVWGRFNWYELQTTRPKEAAAFYAEVAGWSPMNLGPQTNNYTLFMTPRGAIGGVRGAAAAEGPRWNGYVEVEDVDATLARVKAAGGKVLHIPTNVPGVLRFAGVTDPEGGRFVVYRAVGDRDPPVGAADEPGYFNWHELSARDGPKVLEFYAALFGWSRADGPEAGGEDLGWTDGRGFAVGAMLSRPEANAPPTWGFSVRVEAVDAAAERIVRAGGTVRHGPVRTAAGDWRAEAEDPQGARFGLIGAMR